MILCVTLNPCLDKTLTVGPWNPGDNVRGRSIREVVGGKGNNVARALMRLGRVARPITFFGGSVGDQCARLLRQEDGLDPIFVPTVAETRVILTVRDEGHEPTAFFDPDPQVTAVEARTLLDQVERCISNVDVEAMTLSGSSPSPATHELYSELIALARSRRVPTFLDTYGPSLDAIWGFWPHAITLNRREAASHLGRINPTELELLDLVKRWSSQGVKVVMVTNGPDSVLALIEGKLYRALPPTIQVVNPIGSGDCLVAGLVDACLRSDDPESLLKHAVGSASANAQVWDAGAIDREQVKQSGAGVIVEEL